MANRLSADASGQPMRFSSRKCGGFITWFSICLIVITTILYQLLRPCSRINESGCAFRTDSLNATALTLGQEVNPSLMLTTLYVEETFATGDCFLEPGLWYTKRPARHFQLTSRSCRTGGQRRCLGDAKACAGTTTSPCQSP